MSFAIKLERMINGKINKVAKGELTIQEAGITKMIDRLEGMNEAAATEMNEKYIKTVAKLNLEKY